MTWESPILLPESSPFYSAYYLEGNPEKLRHDYSRYWARTRINITHVFLIFKIGMR